ncbi:MAG: hypothetical protein R8M14_00670 [Ghiorsea sp.]
MTSFLNVSLPVLMQVSRAEGGTLLPWPNGSLLSGKLMPLEDAAGALLVLGNYRVRVEVPPNIPMGKVWLELLQREKPGQFRLLTEKQALEFITDLIQKHQGKAVSLQGKKSDVDLQKNEWAKFPFSSAPFYAEPHGERLMLLDDQHSPQGFVQKNKTEEGFMLHGRLDLPQLGTVVFQLQGGQDKTWKVSVYHYDKEGGLAMSSQFESWLEGQREVFPTLEGSLQQDIPEHLMTHTLREG